MLRKTLDNQSRQLFKNSSWVFFSNFYSTALAFIRSVIIARGLGPGIYGTYAIIVAFVGLIQEFLNLNIGTALIKYGAEYHNENRNDKLMALIKSSVIVSFIMAGVSIIAIALLLLFSYETFIDKPGLEWFIIAYAIAASITYLNSISRGLLRLYFKFRKSSVIQMIMDTVETVAIAIAVIFYPADLNIFFIAVIITRLLNGLICNLLAFYELKNELAPYKSATPSLIESDKKGIKKFVLGNSVGNTLKTVINQGDVLLLGALTNSLQVAYYSVAKKLAYSVLTLTDPLSQSIYPQLAKLLAAQQFADVRKMLLRITSLALIPGIIFLLITFFLNEWIIITVYGAEYVEATHSFFYFLAGATLGAVTFWTLPLIQSLGLVKMRVKVYAITIIAGSMLAWLLIPTMQAAGMALALLITNVLNMIVFISEAFKKLPKHNSISEK
jgi:O-antigen/teichoic acid export membrane protein